MKKRILSAILAFLMLVTSLPVVTVLSFAQDVSLAEETTPKTYDDYYAKTEYMDTQIDFFGAKTEDEITTSSGWNCLQGDFYHRAPTVSGVLPLTFSYSEKYYANGNAVTGFAHYEKIKPAAFGDGYFHLGYSSVTATDSEGNPLKSGEYDVNYKVGSNLSWNTIKKSNGQGFHETDENTSYTYEYVLQVNEINGSKTPADKSNFGQFINNSFGRLALYYNANDGTLYPTFYAFFYVNKLDESGNIVPGTSNNGTTLDGKTYLEKTTSIHYNQTRGQSTVKMGECLSVAFTANVYTENGKWISEAAKNGKLSAQLYLNNDKYEFTIPMYNDATGEQYKANAYGCVSNTYQRHSDVNVYALRRYTTILTKDDLAQNRFVDVAKFYQLDLDFVEYIFSLPSAIRSGVFSAAYGINLNRESMTATSVQEKLEKAIVDAENNAYNAFYAQKDSLATHIDFFNAKTSGDTKVTDFTPYVFKGSMGLPNASKEVYLRDGYLLLSHNAEGTVGATISYNTNEESSESFNKFTYEYIVSPEVIVPTYSGTYSISQALCSTFGRIALHYDVATNRIYPKMVTLMYPTSEKSPYGQPDVFDYNDFLKDKDGNAVALPGLGESMQMAYTVNINADGNKVISVIPQGASFSGTVYVDGYGVDYTRPLSYIPKGETEAKYCRLPAYSNSGTGIQTQTVKDADKVNGNEMAIYAIRKYTKELTALELAQNHFVDVAKFYHYDIERVEYVLSLNEVARRSIFNACYDIQLDKAKSSESVAAQIEAFIEEATSDLGALEGTEDILSFEGYQARLSSYAGIRAQFTYNKAEIEALEEQGYSVEMGVIMAIATEGRTKEDLALELTNDGYKAAGEKMLSSSVYKDGSAVGNINNLDSATPDFFYTITYKNDSSKTYENYVTDCIYRGYLIAEKDGLTYITYYDCDSELFDDSISIYELSTYWMYDRDYLYDTLKDVISISGYTDDVKALYSTYKSAQDKVEANGVDSLTLEELNLIYNVTLKSQKSPLLAMKLKYYEPNGASNVDGNIDVVKKCDNILDAKTALHGVEIRDSLYEIGETQGTVYFDVTTDKDPTSYKLGDSVTFNITLRDKTTKGIVGYDKVSYSYSIDGVSKNGTAVSKTGELSATQGTCSFTVPASEIQASTLASQGKGIIIKASATVLGAATQEEFLGGAVVDFDKITAAATEPSDYETFWKSQIERVEAVSPLDTSVTAYTGTGVVISDIKRLNNDVNNQGTFSTTEGQLITDYNYFRIIKVDKERLDYLHSKDLCTGTTESKLNSYNLYEVYLKSPGPTPCVGMLSIPTTLTADTEIVISTCGYGACPPSLGAYGGVVRFVLSHNGYWADASDAELYDELYNGILGSYGRGNGKPNSGYDDPADCYILYMFLRNLQGLRFISDVPSATDVEKIEDANLKAIYKQLNALKDLGGGKIRLTGNSMGGYQTIGGAALAELYNKYNSESAADITVTYADPEVPAFTNLGGHVLDDRLKNAFGIYYEENMNYFEPAFFAPRIKAEVNIIRCGLGDYTCPPSGIIATYNALKCKKTINVYQNSTHGYKIAEEKYIFTLTQDAQ